MAGDAFPQTKGALMIKRSQTIGININPRLLGVLLTDRVGNTLRIFCYYTNGRTSQFDVPAEENSGSRHELFSALNIEPTCISVIHDAAIQGRIHVKTDNQHWLYTLLNSPGSQLPLNADVTDLPWQVVWRSPEMEALQYRPEEDGEWSYAIRARIHESNADRLVKDFQLFTNPVSPARKQPQRWVHLNLGLMLLAVALVAAGTLYYTFKSGGHLARSAAAAPTHAQHAQGGYYLLYHHQISGPYAAPVLADMNAAGLFNPETMCRAEKSTVWDKLVNDFPGPAVTAMK